MWAGGGRGVGQWEGLEFKHGGGMGCLIEPPPPWAATILFNVVRVTAGFLHSTKHICYPFSLLKCHWNCSKEVLKGVHLPLAKDSTELSTGQRLQWRTDEGRTQSRGAANQNSPGCTREGRWGDSFFPCSLQVGGRSGRWIEVKVINWETVHRTAVPVSCSQTHA